uniref:Uncharacterized protein n=1 Tax=Physcomitrium patens TaxID=3218 RepID=A0A2K1JLB7_PHYPA|nr:hypothetical protein PHYPA_016995 [Physcomitrium patens]
MLLQIQTTSESCKIFQAGIFTPRRKFPLALLTSGFGPCSEVHHRHILAFVSASASLLVPLGLRKDSLSVPAVSSRGVVFTLIPVHSKPSLNVYSPSESESLCLSNSRVENIRICYNWLREYLSFVCLVVCTSL